MPVIALVGFAGVLAPTAFAAESPPTITVQPASQTVTVGDTVTLTAASDDPSAQVQWQVSHDGGGSWSSIAGGTSTTLVIPSITQDWSGSYVGASFTNDAGSVATTAALITVKAAGPSITRQPASVSVAEGSDASFVATATGTPPLSVQWSRSNDNGATWTAIAGATSTTYTLKAVTTADNGAQFRAAIAGGDGTSVSNVATLTVTAASARLVLAPVGAVGAGSVAPGTTTTYAAALSNTGTTTIDGWNLTIAASDGVALAPADASTLAPGLPQPTAQCTASGSGLTCPLGAVDAKSTGRVLVSVTIEPAAVPGTATVTAQADAGGKAVSIRAATVTLTVGEATEATVADTASSAPAAAASASTGDSRGIPLAAVVGVVGVVLLAGAIVALVYAVRRARMDRNPPAGDGASGVGAL